MFTVRAPPSEPGLNHTDVVHVGGEQRKHISGNVTAVKVISAPAGLAGLPDLIAPMLAAAAPIPSGPGWAFEFKYDGVRALTYIGGDGVRVLSRNNNDVTSTYPELTVLSNALGGRQAVLDGEIVALEDGDRPSFAKLQARMHVAAPSRALLEQVPVVYYVFDLLHLDGQDTWPLPYAERRRLLADLALDEDAVRTPDHFVDVDGQVLLRAADLAGFEGIVAKRLTAPYRPGKRSADAWTKIPLIRTQEVVVIGYKPGGGRRAGTIGSLLLAVYNDRDQLVFAGHVGTGFTDAALRRLHEQLGPLHRTTAPVPDVPSEHARFAQWVEPVLLGEVAYRNWTPDGRLRHPSWRGLRTDQPANAARRTPAPIPRPSQGTVEAALQTPDGRWRVEIIRRGRDHYYRLVHGDNVIDGLFIATVERLLAEAGVDMADLVDATAELTPPADQHGAA